MTDLAQLLAAERAVRSPPELAQRGLTRLLESVAKAPLPIAATASVTSAKFGWIVASKWIVGGFALGLLGTSVASSLSAPGREPHAQPRGVDPARAEVAASVAALSGAAPPAPEPSAPAAGTSSSPCERPAQEASQMRPSATPPRVHIRVSVAWRAARANRRRAKRSSRVSLRDV